MSITYTPTLGEVIRGLTPYEMESIHARVAVLHSGGNEAILVQLQEVLAKSYREVLKMILESADLPPLHDHVLLCASWTTPKKGTESELYVCSIQHKDVLRSYADELIKLPPKPWLYNREEVESAYMSISTKSNALSCCSNDIFAQGHEYVLRLPVLQNKLSGLDELLVEFWRQYTFYYGDDTDWECEDIVEIIAKHRALASTILKVI